MCAAPTVDLAVALDRGSTTPLAVQLADALRAAAGRGGLRVGDRVPSTRALATDLGVSRTVTAAAYDQLVAEGWLGPRHGSGTYVLAAPAPPPAPAARRAEVADPGEIDLRPGAPCLEVLDRAAWRRAWRHAGDRDPLAHPEYAGLPEFRSAVTELLLRHRGVGHADGGVLATSGTTDGFAELVAVLGPRPRVAVEDPGYRRAVGTLRAAGAEVVGVPVDADGLVVDALPTGLDAVYCTPAHHYPLGARMAVARRAALVERARAEGFLIVEDDYDGELRYDVAPLPVLAALGPDVVVYLGTASKILSPTLGTGWALAPPAVHDALLARRRATGVRPSPAGQLVLASLGADGALARHLARLRRELAARRAEVVAAVTAAGHAVAGDRAGAHLVVPLPDGAVEDAAVGAARAAGLGVDGLADHQVGVMSEGHHRSIEPPMGDRRQNAAGRSDLTEGALRSIEPTDGALRSAPRHGLLVGWATPPRAALTDGLARLTAVLREVPPGDGARSAYARDP